MRLGGSVLVLVFLATVAAVLAGPSCDATSQSFEAQQPSDNQKGIDTSPDPEAPSAPTEGNRPQTFDPFAQAPVNEPLLDVELPSRSKIHDMTMHQGTGTVCMIFSGEHDIIVCYFLKNFNDNGANWEPTPRYFTLDGGTDIIRTNQYWIAFDYRNQGHKLCVSQPTPGGIWCWDFPTSLPSSGTSKANPYELRTRDYVRDGDAVISPGDYHGKQIKMSTATYGVSTQKGAKGSAPVGLMQNSDCGNRYEIRVMDGSFWDSKDKPLFFLNGLTDVNDFCPFFPLDPSEEERSSLRTGFGYVASTRRPAGFDPALVIAKYPGFAGFGAWSAPAIDSFTATTAMFAMPSVTYNTVTKVTGNPTRLERGTLENAKCAQVLDVMLVSDGNELRLLDMSGAPRTSVGPFDGTITWVRSSHAWFLHGAATRSTDMFAVVLEGNRLQVWNAKKSNGTLIGVGAAASIVAIGGAGYAYKRNMDGKKKRREAKRAEKRARRAGTSSGSRKSMSKSSGSRKSMSKSSGSRQSVSKSNGSRRGSRNRA